jgi:hypothetical protein
MVSLEFIYVFFGSYLVASGVFGRVSWLLDNTCKYFVILFTSYRILAPL